MNTNKKLPVRPSIGDIVEVPYAIGTATGEIVEYIAKCVVTELDTLRSKDGSVTWGVAKCIDTTDTNPTRTRSIGDNFPIFY